MKFIDQFKSGYNTLKTGIQQGGIHIADDNAILGKKVPQRKPNKSMTGLELLIKATPPKSKP